MSNGVRSTRTSHTREAILTVAERLYAEQGLQAVSNRHISEAAGQGNNAAVAYHFGTKADLVRAIVDRHSSSIDAGRAEMVERAAGSNDLRDWVSCLIRPFVDHLERLGSPSWYGRFVVQVIADPVLRGAMYQQAGESPTLTAALAGLARCLPDLPADVRRARSDMARNLMIHMCAEKELEFARSHPEPVSNWHDCGTDLIDATVGLWQAPVTRGPC